LIAPPTPQPLCSLGLVLQGLQENNHYFPYFSLDFKVQFTTLNLPYFSLDFDHVKKQEHHYKACNDACSSYTFITLIILYGPLSFNLVSQNNLEISKNAMEVQFTTCELHRFS
jgi:hypothetical protein